MKTGMRVEHKDGRLGMVVQDIMNCCAADEVPIVFDGVAHFEGINEDNLTALGVPKHKPDPKKCGVGKGADCCIFLTAGADGFACEKFGSLRNTLIIKTMTAKRDPVEYYPDCMIFTS